MSDHGFDFSTDDPERLLDEHSPEDLFRAVSGLESWTPRALEIADLAIADWASAALARPRDREGLAGIHSLIQRLQVIQPSELQAPELDVAERYQRWDGIAQVLETRAHGLDHHRPEEVEQRTHMPALKQALAAGADVRTQALLKTLGLSKARLSQLLALAEAAGLIERRREGRQQWVSAVGIWRPVGRSAKQAARVTPLDQAANDPSAMLERGGCKLVVA